MEDADFSDEFCRFVQAAIPTVDAAELLLVLADRPEHGWTVADALEALRVSGVTSTQADLGRHLEALRAVGLVSAEADGRFHYRPGSAAVEKNVLTLAKAYEERPVTLIRMIYALRDARITTFADAFRLRKK